MADEEQIQPNLDAAIPIEKPDENVTSITFRGDFAGWIIGDSSIITYFLGIAASVSSVTQVILMIADMRSRKAKKKPEPPSDPNVATIGNYNYGTDWESIKEIKVQMSDGSWVQIESWLHEPEKVKGFLEVFSSPLASPKPETVVFVFKNGSRLPVTVSTDPQGKDDLDTLIKYLKLE